MGQGQPRVIIWTTLVVLPYMMLHTKFQGHWSIGSGEEDFLRFLPYMGMAAILVMWPGRFEQLFVPPTPGGYIWNLVTIGPVVSEEKSFEIVDGRRTTDDDGRRRTTEPAYTISSPGAFGSGELKKRKEKQKYVARPGIEPRTPGLWVRCPTDCATRPSIMIMGSAVEEKNNDDNLMIP